MTRKILSVILLFFLVIGPAQARDDRKTYSIEEAYKKLNIESQLGKIRLYFDGEAHPHVQRRMGNIHTNRKTNSFNKSDHYACQWVFFSALLALRDRASTDGGNAVINIKSNYKHQEFSSTTQYQCGVGAIIAGVALTGDVVTLSGGSSRAVSQKHRSSSSSSVKSSCSTKKISDMQGIGMTDLQIEQVCGKSTRLSSYDASLTKQVQIALYSQGYNVGQADGMWGGRTRTALRQFQKNNNLTVTGELNDNTLDALGIMSGQSDGASDIGKSHSFTQTNSAVSTSSNTYTGVDKEEINTTSDDFYTSESTKPVGHTTASVKNDSVNSSIRTKIKVSLYSEPDPFSDIIVTIPKDVKLDVITEGSEWVKVIYQGNTGFIVKAENQ